MPTNLSLQFQFDLFWCECGRGFTFSEWVKRKGCCDLCHQQYQIDKPNDKPMILMRSSMSFKVGQKVYNVNGIATQIVKRQVFWSKAIDYANITDWKNEKEPWRYFYYEVEPIAES